MRRSAHTSDHPSAGGAGRSAPLLRRTDAWTLAAALGAGPPAGRADDGGGAADGTGGGRDGRTVVTIGVHGVFGHKRAGAVKG
ncbi:hypothetical protein [Streptomyces zingiberis]|uniref:Uncharacterized protein n=1 Tax=Streptomyces zingiberis TaxID=2053010 RepID=A0ABX1BZF5_9ACTN|nr:hypothetical protein [Streptomyces zingiberis]NJQ02498.1 hypothetical protein [Streptomyces zingiberis]